MTVDRVADWLALHTALAAVVASLAILARSVVDRRIAYRSADLALRIVSDTAIGVEIVRLIVAGLLLAYASITIAPPFVSWQFQASRWLHIGVSLALIASIIYHARQRRRLIDYLEASRGG